MNAYQPYPAYKDSAVEWLGQIPAHWDVRRLKFVAKIFNGATPNTIEEKYWGGTINWVTPEDLGNLDSIYITETKRKITNEGYLSCGTTLVPRGSIIISTRAPIGHIAVADLDVCTNQGCRALVPNVQINSLFLYFVLYTSKSELQSLGSGSTFKELSSGELKDFSISIPNIHEQLLIAAFLDRETAQIDTLITHKRELIDLLRQQRSAIISHAVTKGLDAQVPTKDSGVEWLGEIPAHWEVRRLKNVAPSVNTKLGKKPENKIYIGLENIQSGNGILLFESISENVESIVSAFQTGDVLFGKLRPYLAKVVHANFDGVCTTEILILRPDKQLSESRFLFYMLLTHNFISIIDSMTYGAKMPRANSNQIGNLPACLPPLPEQRSIAEYLDHETARIDHLITEIEASIELLRQQRTALISAAVTGRIDVRGQA
jgi:type I restriction enzyme, S subunit